MEYVVLTSIFVLVFLFVRYDLHNHRATLRDSIFSYTLLVAALVWSGLGLALHEPPSPLEALHRIILQIPGLSHIGHK